MPVHCSGWKTEQENSDGIETETVPQLDGAYNKGKKVEEEKGVKVEEEEGKEESKVDKISVKQKQELQRKQSTHRPRTRSLSNSDRPLVGLPPTKTSRVTAQPFNTSNH